MSEPKDSGIPPQVRASWENDLQSSREATLLRADHPFRAEEFLHAMEGAEEALREVLRSAYHKADLQSSRDRVAVERMLEKDLGGSEEYIAPDERSAKENMEELYRELREYADIGATSQELRSAISIVDAMIAIKTSPALSALRTKLWLRLEREEEREAWNSMQQ